MCRVADSFAGFEAGDTETKHYEKNMIRDRLHHSIRYYNFFAHLLYDYEGLVLVGMNILQYEQQYCFTHRNKFIISQ